jgi:hypothetical protein
MTKPVNGGRRRVARSDRYSIVIVNMTTHDRFDLINTETNRTVRSYGSLIQATIDCRFLNANSAPLPDLAT